MLQAIFLGNIFSDSIILKNGTFQKGKIIGQTSEQISLQTTEGKVVEIPKNRIIKVVFRDVTNEEALQIKKEEEEKFSKLKDSEEKNRLEQEEKLQKERELNEALEKKKQEEELQNSKDTIPRSSVLWRSAVLPGWGQYVQGRKWQGLTYSFLTIAGLGVAYGNHQNFLNAKENYETINNPSRNLFLPNLNLSAQNPQPLLLYDLQFQNARQTLENAEMHRNAALGGLLLVYGLNLFDVTYFNKNPKWFSHVSWNINYSNVASGSRLSSSGIADRSVATDFEYTYALRYLIVY